ncbi:MAG: hypothetical protein WC906_00130 [Parcubacteria group bacterium]|jgi:hypothetical protein
MEIVCECRSEVCVGISDKVRIQVGKLNSQSWIHACVCPVCRRIYSYHTGDPVLTARGEITFFVDGKLSTRRNGNGKGSVFV